VVAVSGKNKYLFRELSAKFKYVASSSIHALVTRASMCSVNPVIVAETNTRHCRGSTPANYTLKYNLMPFVGILTYGEAARVTEPIEFPLARERVE